MLLFCSENFINTNSKSQGFKKKKKEVKIIEFGLSNGFLFLPEKRYFV